MRLRRWVNAKYNFKPFTTRVENNPHSYTRIRFQISFIYYAIYADVSNIRSYYVKSDMRS